jgi:hypothetical protein
VIRCRFLDNLEAVHRPHILLSDSDMCHRTRVLILASTSLLVAPFLLQITLLSTSLSSFLFLKKLLLLFVWNLDGHKFDLL